MTAAGVEHAGAKAKLAFMTLATVFLIRSAVQVWNSGSSGEPGSGVQIIIISANQPRPLLNCAVSAFM